jgi:hypothetical protein
MSSNRTGDSNPATNNDEPLDIQLSTDETHDGGDILDFLISENAPGEPVITETTVVSSLSEVGMDRYVEVGDQAVWSLSTLKEGNGLKELRDDDMSTYWQSDGVAPHTVTLQFPQQMGLKFVCVYLDHPSDETYTPERYVVSTV